MTRIGLGVVLAALGLVFAPTVKSVEPAADVSFPVKASLELTGNLYRPEGAGPFPAVVLMHSCEGLWRESGGLRKAADGSSGLRKVATLLRDSGYVALAVDSFSARHVSRVCGDPGKSPTPPERVEDAFAAARYLSSLAFVDSSRTGLVGWSHGGDTALMTWARNSAVSGSAPFAAIAAYYPNCSDKAARTASAPLLIFIGEADLWSLAAMCKSFVADATALGRNVSIKIYPGATHAFDAVDEGGVEIGHSITIGGARLTPDPAAEGDSHKRLLALFKRTLKRKS